MKTTVVAYLATLVSFVAVDFAWLSFAGDRLYRPALKEIMLDGFRPAPAVALYLVFAAGLVVLAVRPGLAAGSLRLAAGNAALIGLLGYATYDLTNWATLRNWTMTVALVDLAWGVALSAIAASVGFLAARALAA
ncbi:putative membrane protein [Roseiarcus fermentans]|uniref:Putative membrane protein n=1 Tax=Roseiarcus fermentans TaxID=1473586 RepID=A0A366EMA6_9HYPH|nr:DUF2177 family protein [Roseiarcus fermentans]RBP03523.1 putative membrane protein [Roseiarcus fermentans]